MKIKNWKKFQHFKDRNPPWIKLHREVLYQRDINMISDCSFRLLINLWLLASEDETKEGILPPLEDIAWRLRLDEKKIIQSLQELTEWVEQDDINVISERYQVGPPETETEAETEVESLSVRKRTRHKYSDDFEDFWKYASVMYHKTPSGIKGQAFKEWKKDRPDLELAKLAWRNYYFQCKRTDFPTRHIARWLRDRGWDTDYGETKPKNTSWGNETVKISQFG